MEAKDNNKLRRVLATSYGHMNADGRFRRRAVQDVSLFQVLLDSVGNPEQLPVLDFGCGPDGGIKNSLKGITTVSYDPYVPQYSADPWARPYYAAIYSSDVLEHMLVSDVLEFAVNVIASRSHLVYLEIATRPANKQLDNGLNAHITIEPAAWWYGLFRSAFHSYYNVALAWADMVDEVCTLAFIREDP